MNILGLKFSCKNNHFSADKITVNSKWFINANSVLNFFKISLNQTFDPKKKYILDMDPGCEPKPKPKTRINSEFNSLHFGI